MEQIEKIAKALKELGHPIRLQIFTTIIRFGNTGIEVGKIKDELGLAGSTLSHHISALASAGLIHQKRDSRKLMCFVNEDEIKAITTFLDSYCCTHQDC
ncbi:ArsR family transcriptional regulator [Vibrio sp.]|nr:ArsR family transcriptional regulator [Vibrio sp.]